MQESGALTAIRPSDLVGQSLLDPFTVEIIKEGLNAIGDEMFVSL